MVALKLIQDALGGRAKAFLQRLRDRLGHQRLVVEVLPQRVRGKGARQGGS